MKLCVCRRFVKPLRVWRRPRHLAIEAGRSSVHHTGPRSPSATFAASTDLRAARVLSSSPAASFTALRAVISSATKRFRSSSGRCGFAFPKAAQARRCTGRPGSRWAHPLSQSRLLLRNVQAPEPEEISPLVAFDDHHSGNLVVSDPAEEVHDRLPVINHRRRLLSIDRP